MQENINIPDSNITTNLSFRQLVLMNMQQLTNFPYIEKDFDALTDYELLCLVVKFLNDVITNQNEQNDSITNMYNAFLALQTYVNNTKDTLEDAFNELDNYVRYYFDNLDVQEEINNKLDEMLEDGVLEQIIEQFIQSTAIWCFDTVADMQAATNLIDGSFAKTLGYYSVNDGGGATYKITDEESETEYQEEINDNLYATLIVNDYVNPEQFGAYGDGTHDDTNAIKNALSKFNNINFSKTYKITETLGNITNKILFGNGTINSSVDTYLFNTITNTKIQNLFFNNVNTNVDEDSFKIGDFANDLNNSIIENCNILYYSSFCNIVHVTSNIVKNRIIYLNKIFIDTLTDSFVSNNYINASKKAVSRSIMLRSAINNSSFNNNFVDYWKHCFRLKSGNKSSQITGNTFDDCFSVFQDYIQGLSIVGNTFSNIKYVSANWTASQPPQEIQEGVWSIFKFDKTTETTGGNTSMALSDTCFIGNLARNCSYYFYKINENAKVLYLYGQNIFKDNIMFDVTNESIAKFAISQTMWDNKQVVAPYFDFWEGKTYTTLPSPNIVSTTGVVSYDKMRCFLDTSGTITEHININGTWKEYTLT